MTQDNEPVAWMYETRHALTHGNWQTIVSTSNPYMSSLTLVESVEVRNVQPLYTRPSSDDVIAFAKAILHGDEIHREWLMEAAQAWVEGKEPPTPRSALSSQRESVLPMARFDEQEPERDDLRGEQTFLTYNERSGTWDVEHFDAGDGPNMAGLAMGNTHWFDLTNVAIDNLKDKSSSNTHKG